MFCFASSALLRLFYTSTSVVFVDRGRKNISCPRAQNTLATPLAGKGHGNAVNDFMICKPFKIHLNHLSKSQNFLALTLSMDNDVMTCKLFKIRCSIIYRRARL